VLGTVVGDREVQSVVDGGGTQLADHVAFGPHLHGVPMRQGAAVHLEPVVVFGHREVVPGARLGEQVGPFIGVEPFRGEHRDEILVAEFGLRTVGLAMVVEFGVSLDVHVARIPFVAVFGHGVQSPVGEDAELGVGEPCRRPVAGQRGPIRLIRPFGDHAVDQRQVVRHVTGECSGVT